METVDPIFLTGGAPTPVTHLVWGTGDALIRARDLTRTTLGGNLLPATQGQRFTEIFAIGRRPPSVRQCAMLAIARMGPTAATAQPNYVFRYPLARIRWAGCQRRSDASRPRPEIMLRQTLPGTQCVEFRHVAARFARRPTPISPIDPVAWQVCGAPARASPPMGHCRRQREHDPLRQQRVRRRAGRTATYSRSPTAPASAPPATSRPTASR